MEDKTLAELKDHGEEANTDPVRFITKYFLDFQGHPDRQKIKIPLAFNCWNNQDELVSEVKAVPGLDVFRGWRPSSGGPTPWMKDSRPNLQSLRPMAWIRWNGKVIRIDVNKSELRLKGDTRKRKRRPRM